MSDDLEQRVKRLEERHPQNRMQGCAELLMRLFINIVLPWVVVFLLSERGDHKRRIEKLEQRVEELSREQ